MSNYKEQLQQNNNELNAILETVNSLPEAGGGGGDRSVIKFNVTFLDSENDARGTSEFVAYEGMTWEDFFNSVFNVNNYFDGVYEDGVLYANITTPSLSGQGDLCVIMDSLGLPLTDPVIHNGMTIYAYSII